jgi:GDPmannose 4,6-dehydratase
MWMIVQQPQPDDYVLATGESHSVREFVELAFAEVGIEIQWQGSGVNEQGLCGKTGRTLIRIDPRYFRPTEVDKLIGDPAKARSKLNWKHRISFRELVREMVSSDLKLLTERRDWPLRNDRS